MKIGDICTYSFDNDNKSLSIVEIVDILSDNVMKVKFLQVINDDTGNHFFTYLYDSMKTMNVSKKYLNKINIANYYKRKIAECKIIINSIYGGKQC